MKTCGRCGEKFEESGGEYNLARELDEIFLESVSESEADDLCPKCGEDLRVAVLLGFGE